MQNLWRCQPYTEKDLAQIVTFLQTFQQKDTKRRAITAKYFKWKIEENPQGKGLLYIAKDNKEDVIGTISIVFRRLQIKNSEVQFAEMGDGFTDPNYQGKGIFSKLINLVIDKLKLEREMFIYGTPNDIAYPIHVKKLKAIDIEGLKVVNLVRPLKIQNILNKKINYSFKIGNFLNGIYEFIFDKLLSNKNNNFIICQISKFSKEIDEFWHKVKNQHDCIISRDLKYLRWRFIYNPDKYEINIVKRQNEICGYMIVKQGYWKKLKLLYIADFLFNEDLLEGFKYNIDQIIKSAKNKYDGISIWVIKGTKYCRYLKRRGFLKYQEQPVILYLSEKNSKILDKDLKWHFTMADSDNI